MRMIAVMHFPLTLTLSLREREQASSTCDNSNRVGHTDRLATILPLPEGEGRGEGEAIDWEQRMRALSMTLIKSEFI